MYSYRQQQFNVIKVVLEPCCYVHAAKPFRRHWFVSIIIGASSTSLESLYHAVLGDRKKLVDFFSKINMHLVSVWKKISNEKIWNMRLTSDPLCLCLYFLLYLHPYKLLRFYQSIVCFLFKTKLLKCFKTM